jgi:hypothetical protein
VITIDILFPKMPPIPSPKSIIGNIPAAFSQHRWLTLVVGQHDDQHWGVAEVDGKIEPKAVVVDDGFQWLVEELFRHSPFELIESQIQELELRELQDHLWELAGKAIVAEIKLEQKLQSLELVWHSTTKPIRVYVEQCKINKQAGKYPAMSPWLRSMPAMVQMLWLSGAGA